jgi:hypothetical protein
MRKILVEVTVPQTNEQGQQVYEEVDDEKLPLYEQRQGYLHHWGQQFETWADSEGIQHVGQYTVAIVEMVETGRIGTFMPTTVRIMGSTTYK